MGQTKILHATANFRGYRNDERKAVSDQIAELTQRAEAAEKALAEAQKDTKRMDWLIAALNKAWGGGMVRDGLFIRPAMNGHGPRFCGAFEGTDDRAALDAAKEGK